MRAQHKPHYEGPELEITIRYLLTNFMLCLSKYIARILYCTFSMGKPLIGDSSTYNE